MVVQRMFRVQCGSALVGGECVQREAELLLYGRKANITNVITTWRSTMHALKLTQIGNSVGVILPKEGAGASQAGKGRYLVLYGDP